MRYKRFEDLPVWNTAIERLEQKAQRQVGNNSE